ncbi:MAG: Hint domain-containing protein [Rhodobacter sp.]|nr:Hint domain-containing protein [Rhodobacter sp.]
MKTGFRGTFVISWAQTELDGLAGAPVGALMEGASWSWHGRAVRVDGPNDVLILGPSEGTASLRRHAARAVRRLVGAALEIDTVSKLPEPDDPVLESGFAVTDGIRRYTATLIEVPGRAVPLLMFLDELPPAGRDLWVTHVAQNALHPNRSGDPVPSVICFTPDTMIATPDGPRPIRELQEDDRVLTKDDGPQPIRWIGQRRMSGARLFAMPELRPIRIRAGAAGEGRPDADLLVSPEHRVLVKGPVADTLFGSPEVLVAAKDLVNDRNVLVDRRLPEVTYVHLLLDRHQIVFANGLEAETFHPASMPPGTLDPVQQDELADRLPGIERDPSLYGAFARRMLSTAEAAILASRADRPH